MRPPHTTIETAFARIVARPRLTLAIAALITVAAIASWPRLSFSTSLADVVGASSPAASALSDLQRHFEQSNPLILLLEADDARADLGSLAETMAHGIEREADARKVSLEVDRPAVAPPRYITDLLLPAAPWYLDEAAREQLLQRTTPDHLSAQMDSAVALLASPAPSAEVMARRRLADPLGVGDLLAETLGASVAAPASLSPDGRTFRLRVFPGDGHTPDWPAIIDIVRQAGEAALPDHVTLSLTGAPAIAALSERQTRTDLIRGGLVGSVLVALVIVLAYRRFSAIVVVLCPAAASIVWAFGLYAWTGLPLTPLTAAGVAILAGLSVDYSIHVASAIRASTSTDPRSVAASLSGVSTAMACACATTLVACAALALSEVRLLHTLAALGALGLLSALIVSLTVTPALASLTHLAATPVGAAPARTSRIGAIAALALAAVALIAITVSALGAANPLLPFHTSTDVLHPQPNPPLDAEKRMDAAFGEEGATVPILISAESAEALPATAARVAAAINASAELRTGRTLGLHSLVPATTSEDAPPPALRSFWQRADPDTAIAALREAATAAGLSPAAVSDGETLTRRVLTPSPPPTLDQLREAGAPLDRFFAADASPPLTVVLYRTAEPLTDRAAQQRTIGALRTALAPHPEARLTGYAALGLDADRAIRRDLARLAAVAAIGIALCLLLFLRSWWRPWLVFLPVGYALLILLGVMHLTALLGGAATAGLRLDMISIAALPLLIGIGVDDSVFLVSQRRAADGPRHSTRTALHAITTTSATTALAFASLATSAMPALRTLGLAAAVGVAAAWVGAVFLLYPFLHRAVTPQTGSEQHGK